MSEELISYVEAQIRAGFDHATIAGALREKGHDEQTVEHLLVEGQKLVDLTPPAAGVLPSSVSLFVGTFQLILSRLDILGIVLALTVVSGLLPMFFAEATGSGDGFVVLFMSFIAGVVLFINMGVLLYVYTNNDQKPSYVDGLQWLAKRFLSYFWLSICLGALQMGGFILLIVPGIILSIYTALATSVLAAEDARGFTAIMRSRQLVRGRFWKTAITFFLFSLFTVVVVGVSVVGVLFTSGTLSGGITNESFTFDAVFFVFSSIVQISLSALAIGLIAHIYQTYARATAEPLVGKEAKMKYIIIAWIGVMVIPLILASVVLTSLNSAQIKGHDAYTMITISMSRAPAEIYADSVGGSYEGVCAVIENSFVDLRAEGVSVSCNDSLEGYAIEAGLNDGEYYCVDSVYFSDNQSQSIGVATSCK
jgi:hypothetical protein